MTASPSGCKHSMAAQRQVGCPLCQSDGGLLVWQSRRKRVVRALEAEHPVFYRVIWQDHVAEWTDLPVADRASLMLAVARVESVLREHAQVHKINLASLGNRVAHLHWHVVARYDWDCRWPDSVWSAPVRPVVDASQRLGLDLQTLDARIAQAFDEAATAGC